MPKNLNIYCSFEGCHKKRDSGKFLCCKHHKQAYKAKNPLKYTYNTLKQNAKRRGKEFQLTLEQFQEFCNKENYLTLKGTQPSSLSIDRTDNTKGYIIDNIRALTFSENCSKADKEIPCPF